jgi:S1-C subfamily serine protease
MYVPNRSIDGPSQNPTPPPTAAPTPTPVPPTPGPSVPALPAAVDTSGVQTAETSLVELDQTGDCDGGGGLGSAWPIGGSLFLTAAHVVDGETQLIAYSGLSVTADGEPDHTAAYYAIVVLYDPANDIAVVDVPGLTEAALPVASAPPNAGDTVAVVGVAHGLIGVNATTVTGLSTHTWTGIDGSEPVHATNWVQTAGGEIEGDSGGPLVDLSGQVIGVNDAGDAADGGWAVAISSVEADISAAQGLTQPVTPGPTCPAGSLQFDS